MYELGIKPEEQLSADLKVQLAIHTHTMAESKVDNKKNFNDNFLETFKREQLAYKKQEILGNNINSVDVELTKILIKVGETLKQREELEKQKNTCHYNACFYISKYLLIKLRIILFS